MRRGRRPDVVQLVQTGPSATPYRTSYLRLGPSLVTTPEQVEAAIGAVAALA